MKCAAAAPPQPQPQPPPQQQSEGAESEKDEENSIISLCAINKRITFIDSNGRNL